MNFFASIANSCSCRIKKLLKNEKQLSYRRSDHRLDKTVETGIGNDKQNTDIFLFRVSVRKMFSHRKKEKKIIRFQPNSCLGIENLRVQCLLK